MDIKSFDFQTLAVLNNIYIEAKATYSFKEPISSFGKTEKLAVKDIHYFYAKDDSPSSQKAFLIIKDIPDEDLLQFLLECAEEHNNRKEENIAFFTAHHLLDSEAEAALSRLVETGFVYNLTQYYNIEQGEDCLYILLDDSASFCRTLILKQTQILGKIQTPIDFSINSFSFGDYTYLDDVKQLSFFVSCYNIETSESTDLDIRFQSAETKVEIFNASEDAFLTFTPWSFLSNLCYNIVEKSRLAEDYLNQKETDLLPLMKEIIALDNQHSYEHADNIKFDNLISLLDKYNYKGITPLLNKLSNNKLNSKQYETIANSIFSKLNSIKYEPLWREIFNSITESQQDYPSKMLSSCPKELLFETRERITKKLTEHGCEGEYPNFYKIAPMKGLHSVSSYELPYIVGMKKRVTYYIHCSEAYDAFGSDLRVQFSSGTNLLKNQTDKDFYTCLFNSNGHTFYNNIYSFTYLDDNDEPDNLELIADIAVKRAECLPLTKEEKKIEYVMPKVVFNSFLLTFIITGGLFACFFYLAIILLLIVFNFAFGLFDSLSEMFTTLPLRWIFILSWVGFGLPMGIIDIIRNKK